MSNREEKWSETIKALRALAKGNGPDAANARKMLAALEKKDPEVTEDEVKAIVAECLKKHPTLAMGPQPSAQVTRHSPHAGLLDDVFGTGPARVPHLEGSRLVLETRDARRL